MKRNEQAVLDFLKKRTEETNNISLADICAGVTFTRKLSKKVIIGEKEWTPSREAVNLKLQKLIKKDLVRVDYSIRTSPKIFIN
jgi:hypothetical protein